MVRKGHDVTVLTTNRNNISKNVPIYLSYEVINGVKIHRFNSLLNIGYMSFCPGQLQLLKNINYDIIHSHSYRHPHEIFAIKAGKKKDKPVIIQGHGPFLSTDLQSYLKHFFYSLYDTYANKKILKKVSQIIALTEFEKEEFVKLGVDPAKIAILPNAVEDTCFEFVETVQTKRKYNLIGQFTILYLGLLNKQKRPDLLILALSEIVKTNNNITLLFAGPDQEMKSELQQLALNLGVGNHIQFLGPVYGQEKQALLAAVDVLALPSDNESFGIVLLEAMAHCKPVVACDAEGPKNIVNNEFNGFLVPRGDAIRFAKSLIWLADNPELAKEMGLRGKDIALQKYHTEKIMGQLENLYKRVINNHKMQQPNHSYS